jgi:protease-4
MQSEYFVERKKLKQQLINWKICCVILIAAAIALSKTIFTNKDHIAILQTSSTIGSIYINGIITEDKKRSEKLEKIYKNDDIKALIVHINSPGGTTGGSEGLYAALRKISAKKPVVAVMHTLAASGGYMAAIAADHVVAHNMTITGSIGVLWQNAEILGLAEKLGITFNNFKSGPLKAAPNMTEKVTPEVEEAVMSSIKDSYDYFISLVSERRKMPKDRVMQISDGRIYTGRQAYELKLIDQLGTGDDALKWLHEERKIDPTLKVVEIDMKSKTLMQRVFGEDLDQKISNLFMGSGTFSSLMMLESKR